MVQAIVIDQAVVGDWVFAVHYDPATKQVSYIPTQLGERNNGSKQAAFSDQDQISPWAEAAVAETAKAGIITGMAGQAFAPKDFATRAQAAVMLNRFLQAVGFIG